MKTQQLNQTSVNAWKMFTAKVALLVKWINAALEWGNNGQGFGSQFVSKKALVWNPIPSPHPMKVVSFIDLVIKYHLWVDMNLLLHLN